MSENKERGQSTEEKMEELFALMEEKAAAGELDESEPAPKGEEADTTPMSESETAAYEYSMMMRQYEAMLIDYQRREAEEKAAAEAAKEKENKD